MQSQNFGQQTPTGRTKHPRRMELSTAYNVKKHFFGFKFIFLHHKIDTLTPSKPATLVFNVSGGIRDIKINPIFIILMP
jgi:hypothetical protein